MKKTLLAAALLAGFSTVSVAQAGTSVTLYGTLDTSYGYQSYKLESESVISTSSGLRGDTFAGNHWGLRGSEDLGDGMRAIFQLEAGFDLATGSGGGFTRQSFMGLSSDSYGTFTLGRQYSASVDTDMTNNGVHMGDRDKVFGASGFGSKSGTRVDRSFKYRTPNFSGLQGFATYGTGTLSGTTVTRSSDQSGLIENRGNRLSLGLLYLNGPMGIGASYDRESNHETDDTKSSRHAAANWQINGSYDFEVMKLTMAYGQDHYDKIGWSGDADNYVNGVLNKPNEFDNFKSKNYHVGMNTPLGGGALYTGWSGSTSNLKTSDLMDSDGSISAYHINYHYPLSKRTSVYAFSSYGENLGYIKDLKGTETGVGINHKF